MSDLTPQEQEQITSVAIDLLSKPMGFRTGAWECRLYEGPKGRIIPENELPPDHNLPRACDANGLPLSQYCIEGAVNRAAIMTLGEERARALGAHNPERIGDGHDGGAGMAEKLGLNDIAFELYRDSYWGGIDERPDRAAMNFNDGTSDEEGVLEILRTKLDRLREKMGKKPIGA